MRKVERKNEISCFEVALRNRIDKQMVTHLGNAVSQAGGKGDDLLLTTAISLFPAVKRDVQRDVHPVVADTVRHVLEATLGDEDQPPRRVASPARGMFRFGDMVSDVSLLYFTNLFQIVDECIPYLGILFDIGLHLFIVNELQRIAVLQIEVALFRVR